MEYIPTTSCSYYIHLPSYDNLVEREKRLDDMSCSVCGPSRVMTTTCPTCGRPLSFGTPSGDSRESRPVMDSEPRLLQVPVRRCGTDFFRKKPFAVKPSILKAAKLSGDRIRNDTSTTTSGTFDADIDQKRLQSVLSNYHGHRMIGIPRHVPEYRNFDGVVSGTRRKDGDINAAYKISSNAPLMIGDPQAKPRIVNVIVSKDYSQIRFDR